MHLAFCLGSFKIVLPDTPWCSQPPASSTPAVVFTMIRGPGAHLAAKPPKPGSAQRGVSNHSGSQASYCHSKPQWHGEHHEQCTKGSEVASARWPGSGGIGGGGQTPRVPGSASPPAVLPAGTITLPRSSRFVCEPGALRNGTCRRGAAAAAHRGAMGSCEDEPRTLPVCPTPAVNDEDKPLLDASNSRGGLDHN